QLHGERVTLHRVLDLPELVQDRVKGLRRARTTFGDFLDKLVRVQAPLLQGLNDIVRTDDGVDLEFLDRVRGVVRVTSTRLESLLDQPERLLTGQPKGPEVGGVLVDRVDQVFGLVDAVLGGLDDDVKSLLGRLGHPGAEHLGNGRGDLLDVLAHYRGHVHSPLGNPLQVGLGRRAHPVHVLDHGANGVGHVPHGLPVGVRVHLPGHTADARGLLRGGAKLRVQLRLGLLGVQGAGEPAHKRGPGRGARRRPAQALDHADQGVARPGIRARPPSSTPSENDRPAPEPADRALDWADSMPRASSSAIPRPPARAWASIWSMADRNSATSRSISLMARSGATPSAIRSPTLDMAEATVDSTLDMADEVDDWSP